MSELQTRILGAVMAVFSVGMVGDILGFAPGQMVADAGAVVLFAGFALYGLKMMARPDLDKETGD